MLWLGFFSWWQMKSHESGSILNCTCTFICSDRFTMSLVIFQSFFILVLCLCTVHVCHVAKVIDSSHRHIICLWFQPIPSISLFAPLPVCTATIRPREYNVLHLRIMFCVYFVCSLCLGNQATWLKMCVYKYVWLSPLCSAKITSSVAVMMHSSLFQIFFE